MEPQAEAEVQESTNDKIVRIWQTAKGSPRSPKESQNFAKDRMLCSNASQSPPSRSPEAHRKNKSLFTQGRFLRQVFRYFLTKTTTTTNLKKRHQQTKILTSNSRSAIERVNLMGCPQICWCDPITNSDLSRELGWVLQMCINILFDLIWWSAFSNRKPSGNGLPQLAHLCGFPQNDWK